MHHLSNRQQLYRHREIATLALRQYGLKKPRMHFIHHGENTTYRVESSGKRYLLRVHRWGYHTPPALMEEIAWLRSLAKSRELNIPKPVKSKSGKWQVLVKSALVPEGRYCDLLEWVHGSFARKNMSEKVIFDLGALIATIQNHTGKRKVKHRRYWTPHLLVGSAGKFGAIDKLPGVSKRDQKILTTARKDVLRKLLAFQKKFPHKQGLIHADLHFGNFVIGEDGLGAIDFDDCGFGFHAYDLAIPLTQLHGICKDDPERLKRLADALQSGYASKRAWDEQDREILPILVTSRRLLMLGWLNSRSENAEFRKVFPAQVKRVLKHLAQQRQQQILRRGKG